MSDTTVLSSDIQLALEESRALFLTKKITIDDVSRDIRSIEKQLNDFQVEQFFRMEIGYALAYKFSTEVEFDDRHGPMVRRHLVWTKHGDRWRLFFEAVTAGYRTVGLNASDLATLKEEEKLEPLVDSGDESVWLGHRLDFKPLIDTSSETRTLAHPHLAKFVREFAKVWNEEKYADNVVPF